MKKPLKRYGRVHPNALDKLLAGICILVAVAALWISIGICIADSGDIAAKGFYDYGIGLIGLVTTARLGGAAASAAIAAFSFYLSLILLVVGSITMARRKHGERIPGLVAIFVAAIGFGMILCVSYEVRTAKAVAGVWGYGSVVFLVILFVAMIFSGYKTFTFPVEEEVQKEEPAVAPTPIEDLKFEIKEEEPEEEPAQEEQTEEPKEEEGAEEPVEEEKPEEEPVAEEKAEPEAQAEVAPIEESKEAEKDGDFFDSLGKRRKRIPFENKIRRADSETKKRYKDIVAALREYKFNDRMSIPGETFSYKRKRIVFITMARKTLKVHFALDPKEFENSPIPMKDASEAKRFEDIPSYLKIKSDLAVRRVIALAKRLVEENNVPTK